MDWCLVEGALAIRPTLGTVHGGQLQEVLLLSRRLPKNVTLLGFGFAALGELRSCLGLGRAALFLRSKSGRWLSGLVGTTIEGELVDERNIRHAVDPEDEALWLDLAQGKRSYEMFENAPLVTHGSDRTQMVGRGWFVKTPVVDGQEPLGLLYNDGGLSAAPFRAETQELVAAFASLIAPQLHALRDKTWPLPLAGLSREVAECVEILAVEPHLSQEDLARRIGVTDHRLSRAFRREMGIQLVQYRNELRLERFFALVEAIEHEHGTECLLGLALESGFGSYSQFHRVFTARFGCSPRRHLRP